MALHVTVKECQQWFERTKLEIGDVDSELESTAVELVFSKLASKYPDDVETWANTETTPRLVRKILSMLYAAWFYQRQYSEEDPKNKPYAQGLEDKALMLVDGILMGAIDLIDVPPPSTSVTGPVFWPTDTTGSTQQYDGLGYPVGAEDGADTKFRMGMMF